MCIEMDQHKKVRFFVQYGRYNKPVRKCFEWHILDFTRHLSDIRAYGFSINISV